MADLYGNIIPVPGFTPAPADVTPDEILKSTVGFTQIGVTLAMGQGTLVAGTVLARKTSDKKYYAYDADGSDGLDTARGILRQAVDTTDADYLGNMVIAGILAYSKLDYSGLDSAAITDLNGRLDTTRDLFKF